MKIVIIGAGGVIGNAFYRAFSQRFPGCLGLTTRNHPFLTTVRYDAASLREYIVVADVIVYCIGVSKFAECEQHPEKSIFLNAQLPQQILKQLSGEQTLVYFSSPIAIYDFGAAPVCAYARHKRMAEENLRQENVLVIRPSKVIESMKIIHDWKTTLGHGRKITAYADQSISPVNTALLSEQLDRLIRGKLTGVYNFSACDRLSYLDLAKALCAYLKFDPGSIHVKSARQDNPFFFEQDVLDCSAAEKKIGYVPPLSKDVANGYIQTLYEK
ncbi:MAG: sugar nucleotide-binding protein [Bdellovibrionales bacterium]